MPTPEIEQILDNHESQPDQIHGAVQQLTSMPNWDRKHYKAVGEIATHPSSNTDHLSKLYNHMKTNFTDSDPEVGGYKPNYTESEAVAAMADSGKMASTDAEDFIKRTAGSGLVNSEKVAKVGGVSKDLLKDLTTKAWQSGESRVPDYGLDQDFAYDLFAGREIPPIEQTLTPEQRPQFNRTRNLDSYFLDKLTQKHTTPQSLERSTNFFTSEKPEGMGQYDFWKSKSKFIKNNEDLNGQQLESMFDVSRHASRHESGSDYAANEALKHKNIPPEVLSKVVLNNDGSFDDELKEHALSNGSLPVETINSLIDNNKVSLFSGLSKNPKVTPENLTKMYENTTNSTTKKEILTSDKAPVGIIEDYWAKSKKATDDTMFALNSIRNLPKTVLIDIVSKNKNQDLSIMALKHKDADIEVVNAGLKRKAVAVQEAAALNPLVAKQQAFERISDGRKKAIDIYEDGKTKRAIGDLTEDNYRLIDAKNTKDDSSTYVKDDLRLKYHIAIDEKAPPDIREKNTQDLIKAFKEDNPHATDALLALAFNNDGNQAAQMAIAVYPRHINKLPFNTFTNKNLSPGFIEKVYNDLGNADGDSVSSSAIKAAVAKNPNSSDGIFLDALQNKTEDMLYSRNSNGYSSWRNINEEANITFLDDRFSGKSDEEINNNYQKILEMNKPELNKLILESRTTPTDIFNNVFNAAEPSDKKELLESYPQKLNKLNQNTFNGVINGNYNYGENDSIQRNAIKNIDIKNDQHVEAIQGYISRVFGAEDPVFEPGFMPIERFAGIFNNRYFEEEISHPNFEKIIDTATDTNTYLGVTLAIKKMDVTDNPSYLINKINDKSSTPEGIVSKWQIAIPNIPIKQQHKGKFDFLYNLPEDTSGLVKEAAFNRGLFSSGIILNEAMRSPDNLSKAFSTISINNRPEIIQKVLENPSGPMMDALSNNLSIRDFFHPSHGRDFSAEYFEHSKDFVGKITEAAVNTKSTKAIKIISDYISGSSSDNYKFTKTQKKALVNKISSSIDSSTGSDIDKNQAKLDLYTTVTNNRNGSDYISSSFLNNLVKGVIKSKDIDTLVNITNSSNETPVSIQKEISSLMKKPESLSTSQVMSLSNIFLSPRVDKIDLESVKRVTTALQSKALIDPEEKTAISIKLIHISDKMLNLGNTTSDKPHDEKSFKHFSNLLENMLQDPDHNVVSLSARSLYTALAANKAPTIDKVKSLLKIPSNGILSSQIEQSVSKDILDDPDMILEAGEGWKLDMYINNADKAGKEALNTISERLSTSGGDEKIKKFIEKSLSNSYSDYDDTIKLLNITKSNGLGDQYHVNGLRDNFHNPAAQALIDHTIDHIDNTDSFVTNNKTLQTISHRLINSESSEDVNHEIRSKLIKSHLKTLDKLSLVDSSDQTSEQGNENLKSHFSFLNSITNRAMNAENSNNLIDSIKEYGDRFYKKQEYDGSPNPARVIHMWAGSSDSGSINWDSAIKKIPEIYKSFSSFNNISESAIKSISTDSLNNEDKLSLLKDMKAWPTKISPDALPVYINIIKSFSEDIKNPDKRMDITSIISGLSENHSQLLSDDDIDFFEDLNPSYKTTLIVMGAGSPGMTLDHLKQIVSGKSKEQFSEYGSPILNNLSSAASRANINKESASLILSAIEDNLQGKIPAFLEKFTENKNTDLSILNLAFDSSEKNNTPSNHKVYKNLSQHSKIDYELFNKVFNRTKDNYDTTFNPGKPFNPAFLNKTFGGKLFRSLPVTIPEKLTDHVNSDPDKLIYTTEFSKDRDAIRSALPLVPPEGISFQDFKKTNKALAETNAVKAVFQSSNKQTATPESLSRALDQYGGDYHITYTSWASTLQRHLGDQPSSAPNIVVQLNTGEHMQNELASDEKLWKFFQTVQRSAQNTTNGAVGSHPVTPHSAAWVRIDPSGHKNGWVIEEFQSDFTSSLRGEIEKISREYPGGLTLDGDFYHPDDMAKYQKKIEKTIGNWHEAAVRGVVDLAKKQGIENLFLHGEGVRATLSGMKTDKENPVWMQHMYNRWPKNNGWEEVDYNDYPVKSESFAKKVTANKRSTQCWKLKIT